MISISNSVTFVGTPCIEIINRCFYSLGTTVVTATWFWLVAGLFLFVDVTGRPSFLMRYKIQDAKAVPVSMLEH